jgi:hypothetical protein
MERRPVALGVRENQQFHSHLGDGTPRPLAETRRDDTDFLPELTPPNVSGFEA